jgi:hypothetical protein
MGTFVIAAALASIGITALLAVTLGRINVPPADPKKRADGGDGGAPVYTDGSRRDADHGSDDSGSDGGGDGGGD